MIKRDRYLNQLIKAKNNGFPKVITGVRRCGKSFLLKEIYREYLLSENIPESRIIIMELDDDKNSKYRDPLELGAYIRGKCKEKDNYYVPFGIFFAFFSERFEFIGVCSSESALRKQNINR